MPKRFKKELAAIRAKMDRPPDPDAEFELAELRLALARDFLAEYESGTHGFANLVELTQNLTEATRQDIARFEAIIAKHKTRASGE